MPAYAGQRRNRVLVRWFWSCCGSRGEAFATSGVFCPDDKTLSCGYCSGQSGFVHLPVAELLSLCVLKEHPEAALSGPPALRVREAVSGFSAGLLPGRKGENPPWPRPLRGLIAPTSPPPSGPETAARLQRAEAKSKAKVPAMPKPMRCTEPRGSAPLSSQIRRGVAAPSIAQAGVVPTSSTRLACSRGVSNQAFSLGHLSSGLPINRTRRVIA